MTDISIRPYRPSDMLAVLTLSADTAYFGEPVEAFLEDRQLYNEAFARYYLEHETDFAWVASDAEKMIGFLLGCADTKTQTRDWHRYIIQTVLLRALAGRYQLGHKTAIFARDMLVGQIRGEVPTRDTKKFPAHLQIDVKQGYRGAGIGRKLIDAYLNQLRNLGIVGVHLDTTSYNLAACHLYERMGFLLLDQRLNRFWTKNFGFRVDNRLYALELTKREKQSG